jgi:hypothetical protein
MSVYFEIKQLAFIFCAAKVHDALTHVELNRWASRKIVAVVEP